jgi:hypothetical protein
MDCYVQLLQSTNCGYVCRSKSVFGSTGIKSIAGYFTLRSCSAAGYIYYSPVDRGGYGAGRLPAILHGHSRIALCPFSTAVSTHQTEDPPTPV